MKELPKWFTKQGGEQYTEGGTATNPFSRSSIALNNNELSMYDFIIGCQRVVMDRKIQTDFRKAMDWFRKANPEAYMVLLD